MRTFFSFYSVLQNGVMLFPRLLGAVLLMLVWRRASRFFPLYEETCSSPFFFFSAFDVLFLRCYRDQQRATPPPFSFPSRLNKVEVPIFFPPPFFFERLPQPKIGYPGVLFSLKGGCPSLSSSTMPHGRK